MAGENKGQAQVKLDQIASFLGEKKDQTVSYLGEKKDQTVNYLGETQFGKQKASETAQPANATTDAGKEKTGNIFQQAGETVTNAAAGTVEAVKSTLGMGGNKDTDAKP